MGCGCSNFAAISASAANNNNKQQQTDLGNNLAWLQDKSLTERYDVLQLIGRGSIGEVSIVRRKQSVPSTVAPLSGSTTKQRSYAMKTIYVSRMSKALLKELENEVALLQQLHHPNIIQLREVFFHKRQIFMLMDLCTGGTIASREFSEDATCSIITQILRALVYLHDTRGICHRDLKLENVMLESAGEPYVVKLIDFGLSQVFAKGEQMKTACGTVYTMAPEVLLGGGYTQKADLWSVGVIAYMLICGEAPFLTSEADFENEDKVANLATAHYELTHYRWAGVTQEAKKLIQNLFRKVPGFRWSAKEALQHCRTWQESIEAADYQHMQRLVLPSSREPRTLADMNDVVHTSAATSASVRGTPPQKAVSGSSGGGSSSSSSSHRKASCSTVDESITSSLRCFANYGELKKAALMITAFQLDKEELSSLKAAFLEIDSEQNGIISYSELHAVLTQHGADDKEVERLFSSMDQDQTRQVHYMEFLAATLEARGFIEEEKLVETFQRIDVDNTGHLSRANLRSVMGSTLSESLLDSMLAEGNAGRTGGEISLDAFVRLMRPTMRATRRADMRQLLDTPQLASSSAGSSRSSRSLSGSERTAADAAAAAAAAASTAIAAAAASSADAEQQLQQRTVRKLSYSSRGATVAAMDTTAAAAAAVPSERSEHAHAADGRTAGHSVSARSSSSCRELHSSTGAAAAAALSASGNSASSASHAYGTSAAAAVTRRRLLNRRTGGTYSNPSVSFASIRLSALQGALARLGAEAEKRECDLLGVQTPAPSPQPAARDQLITVAAVHAAAAKQALEAATAAATAAAVTAAAATAVCDADKKEEAAIGGSGHEATTWSAATAAAASAAAAAVRTLVRRGGSEAQLAPTADSDDDTKQENSSSSGSSDSSCDNSRSGYDAATPTTAAAAADNSRFEQVCAAAAAESEGISATR